MNISIVNSKLNQVLSVEPDKIFGGFWLNVYDNEKEKITTHLHFPTQEIKRLHEELGKIFKNMERESND